MGYRIEGRTQSTEVQGGNQAVTVYEYHVYSLPSETYFQFRRPKAKATSSLIASVAKQLSDRIEAVLGLATVVDVQYFQDTTPGGLLRDMMRTFYATADDAVQGSVESDLAHFGPNYTGNQVAAEIASGGDQLIVA